MTSKSKLIHTAGPTSFPGTAWRKATMKIE
jgi:hypothetical protein